MGIIKAAVQSVKGGLADQWLEVIQPRAMGDTTVMTTGVSVRRDKKHQNKGREDAVSNGSIIQVEQNQFMFLTDGGRVVDYTAEPGYYEVSNSSLPSMMNGQFGEALTETFNRLRFGGASPFSQKVYYINLQEIKNIAFGTVSPIGYFDNFYNAELFLRAHGYFSIKITDPLKFFAEAIPKDREQVEITDIHKLYLAEFLTALQSAIGQMSVDGIRISHVASKGMELARYMSSVLDEEWNQRRGMCIETVGINSISYDEESKKLINMRNQGAMLSDPSLREGYVQGAVARGLEAAGSNKNGAAAAFMGMNMGSQTGGAFTAAASQSNRQAMEAQQGWRCTCGAVCSGNFCPQCGKQKSKEAAWQCTCGAQCTGNFCPQCGAKRPVNLCCPNCGCKLEGQAKFCPQCGQKV